MGGLAAACTALAPHESEESKDNQSGLCAMLHNEHLCQVHFNSKYLFIFMSFVTTESF